MFRSIPGWGRVRIRARPTCLIAQPLLIRREQVAVTFELRAVENCTRGSINTRMRHYCLACSFWRFVMGQLIRSFFWVPGKAEEAANFWVSIFPDSKIDTVTPLTDDGSVTVVEFSLAGQEFLAMNAGDAPAPSFNVSHLIR